MKRPKITLRSLKRELNDTKLSRDYWNHEAQQHLAEMSEYRLDKADLQRDIQRLRGTIEAREQQIATQQQSLVKAFQQQNVLIKAIADYQQA